MGREIFTSRPNFIRGRNQGGHTRPDSPGSRPRCAWKSGPKNRSSFFLLLIFWVAGEPRVGAPLVIGRPTFLVDLHETGRVVQPNCSAATAVCIAAEVLFSRAFQPLLRPAFRPVLAIQTDAGSSAERRDQNLRRPGLARAEINNAAQAIACWAATCPVQAVDPSPGWMFGVLHQMRSSSVTCMMSVSRLSS